jgi:FkbM family methyltransferase
MPAPSTAVTDAFWRSARLCRALVRFPATRQAGKRWLSALARRFPGPRLTHESQLADKHIILDLTQPADRDIYLYGRGDPRGVGAIERVMRRLGCRTALDVGANRGNHAAFMRRHSHRLFAFEPHPFEYQRLAALFAGDGQVTALNLGLSDTDGELPFRLDEANSGISTFEIGDGLANATSLVCTGDAFAADYALRDIDFIKIDVEGHEAKVLRGLAGVIRAQRPVIIMEILESQSRPEAGFEALLPGYRFFGNRTGFWSGLTLSAYDFCAFRYGKTYMSALMVPEEKVRLLRGLGVA